MRKPFVLAAALALLLAPGVCSAQHGAAWRDSAQRLYTAAAALKDSLLQGDSTAAEVARRGDLAISASPNQTRNALDALTRFIEARTRRFNDAVSPSPAGFRIVMRTQTFNGRYNARDSAGVVILSGGPDSATSVRTERGTSSNDLTTRMIDQFGEMMIASVPQLSAWMETPPPMSMNDRDRRDQVMYTFVTAMGPIERRCVAGGLVACKVALGIRKIDGPENGGRYSPFIRADVLYFALNLGGPGAWSRLRASSDSGVEAMLSAAAKMPADSVLARWQRGLLALRPVVAVVPMSSGLIAIAWTLVFLAGALGASKWA